MNHLNISPEWIEFLFGHLRHESKLLDRAIESALEVKDMLKTQRSEATEFYRESSGNGAAMVSQIDRNESVRKHLGKMNRRIQRISTPILASVLVYTLNHYDQLLGSSNQSDFYNASGQTSEATAKSSYVKTSC